MTRKVSRPEVIFPDSGVTTKAEPGETLLSCLRRAGFSVEATCNGRGKCGMCRVTAQGDVTPPDEKERAHLAGLSHDVRLACRTKVMGRVSVTISDDWTRLETVFCAEGRAVRAASLVKRLALPEVQPGSSRTRVENLPVKIMDPRVLNKLATWDARMGPGFGVVFQEELVDVVPESRPLLGAAVDVGTTSLSLFLFDLESGQLVGRSSGLNPQTAYGGDVITRIGYCKQDPNGLSTLRSAVIHKLGEMIDEALGSDRTREHVYLMIVAGNTTMLHILAGVQPISLALAPFRPTFLQSLVLTGAQSDLPINPAGRCILLPGVAAYIGADIVAGLAAIDFRSRGRVTLFIDMGTNGEIVLIQGPDRVIAASCALGPALEGMNISCGCRAIPGAVDSFALDDDLAPRFTTIGGLPPVGICGSGLIDVVASLAAPGLILPGGAFNSKADKRLKGRMNGDRYHLTDNVFLSQHDIRQVQLAKGALTAGILVVLEEAGLTSLDVEEIIVAGAFGYHLNPQNLKRIGLLPPDYEGIISFVGNSSLTGASLALINEQMMKEIEQIPAAVEVLELSSHPEFSRLFIASLSFPEKAP